MDKMEKNRFSCLPLRELIDVAGRLRLVLFILFFARKIVISQFTSTKSL